MVVIENFLVFKLKLLIEYRKKIKLIVRWVFLFSLGCIFLLYFVIKKVCKFFLLIWVYVWIGFLII